jgi:type I restriction enzyme S subunit
MKEEQLPSHWKHIELDEIAQDIQYGYTESASDEPVGPKFLRITDIQNGRVDWDSVPFCEIDEGEIGKYQLKTGDLLFARTGGTVGKSYLIQQDVPEEAVFASYLIRVKLNDAVDPRFAYYFFQTHNYWRQISESKAGIGQPNVNASKLSSLTLPLPLLPEQRRIVAKIEELFSNLAAGINDLQAAGQQLERYRLSVLQAAVEGRLTADWRRTHDPEPADQLLDRILEERREKWEEDYRAKYEAKGKELPKYWKNRYSPPEEPDLPDDLQEIPGSWEWTSLGYMCDMTSGGTPKRSNDEYWQGDIPWLKSGELNDGVVTEAEERITEKGLEESSTNIFPSGTLLVALYGATTGKLGILDFASATNQAVCGLFITDSLDTKYVFWYLRQFRPELLSKRFGGAQKNISQTILRQVPVPLPPLDEQKQIVDEIERLLSVADDATATAEREHTRAERLRQSILKQAFSGRLVPHDEDATPPAIESSSSDGSPSSASEETDSSSGEDDVIAEELYNGGDPGKQIEMDL